MKCTAHNHDELAATKEGCPYCGSATEAFYDEMAESITRKWRSFDTSPKRSEIKERLRVAIASAIVKELMFTTEMELRGNKLCVCDPKPKMLLMCQPPVCPQCRLPVS